MVWLPMRIFWLSMIVALLPISLPAQPPPPRVRTAQGELVGAVTTLGPYVFKGIPYAAPPVGPLRWHAPHPPASWQGVRKATAFGPSCMQPPSGQIPASAMSEDCLYLNVWTSNLHPPIAAPVMVFIPGGAFVAGSGSQPAYDGANLAIRGAVVVTINYRLGVFGFFAHPDLTAASPHRSSGNYGLLDMMAALRWVRQNIASFGGNPHNVTVFGQSAGASCIGYLMVSPLAKGLFDKAILESPDILFTVAPELQRSYAGLTSMEAIGLAVAPHISDLRGLSARELMHRANSAAEKLLGPDGTGRSRLRPETSLDTPTHIALPWAPFVDGYVIPAQPARLYKERRFLHIPTMAGTNADEGNIFLTHYHPDNLDGFRKWVERRFAPCSRTVLRYYAPSAPAEAHEAANHLITDAVFLHSTFLFARDTHGFLYRFSRVSPAAAKSGLGAFHSAELPYVFGHTRRPGMHYAEIDHRLSDQMMTMWIHFARTGDPSLLSSSWNRIGANDEIDYMDFGNSLVVKPWPDSNLITFADPHVCKSNDFASIR
jgi:para-nitrobenzyl esterase